MVSFKVDAVKKCRLREGEELVEIRLQIAAEALRLFSRAVHEALACSSALELSFSCDSCSSRDPEAHGSQRYLERLQVKRPQGHSLCLRVGEIDWIEASNQYVRLHTGEKSYLLRESMTSLEKKLDPKEFLRIHRSTIVNLNKVRGLKPGKRHVVLTRDRCLQASQRSWKRLRHVLEGRNSES